MPGDGWELIIWLVVAFLFGVGFGMESASEERKKKRKSDD